MIDFVPTYDATIVARLAAAGAIMLGKTNTVELAAGGSAVFGPARNPWNLNYYTGGSSSGSAGSVASGMAAAATGSYTGGFKPCASQLLRRGRTSAHHGPG